MLEYQLQENTLKSLYQELGGDDQKLKTIGNWTFAKLKEDMVSLLDAIKAQMQSST